MKTVFQWLLVATCLFTVGNVQVMASSEEKKEEVKISIPISTGEPCSRLNGYYNLDFYNFYIYPNIR